MCLLPPVLQLWNKLDSIALYSLSHKKNCVGFESIKVNDQISQPAQVVL